jgi:tetratricopeptide (TPR) repeat protein/DNA-binding XRE family transcriptional regulator
MSQEAAGFGARLRACREAAQLSQEDLATRSGLSLRTIGNLEQGHTRWPHQATVQRLADGLDLRDQARAAFVATLKRRRGRTTSGVTAGKVPGTDLSGAVVPRQLPGVAAHFTGRAAELTVLDALLDRTEGRKHGTLVISAIGGSAGVGKTALSVYWAHRVAERFPDGQLYVNLRGYDPAQPVPAADALAGFLRALGVPGQDIPPGQDERAARFRSLLAGKRILVVLDNAGSVGQVRPLLPGEPGCVAVVTSRDSLAGLVAADGALRMEVGLLPLADALALLRSLIGTKADDDPEATAELTALCARLPLALRIAAELAAARGRAPLRELVAELSAHRLDCLDAGEDRTDVRAVFSWSFRHLPDDAAKVFALMGLHPGAELDVTAAAALAGTTVQQARRALDRLHRASLVQATAPGRYGMHDLLRAYASEQAAARDADGSSYQALTRLFDYYLAGTAAAMDLIFPADAHRRPRITAEAVVVPVLAGPDEARAWLDRERANLVAVVVYSANHGWGRHAAGLAETLRQYLVNGGHLPEAETIYGLALRAARQSGDLAAEARALNSLGAIAIVNGRLGHAVGRFKAALELYRDGGDRAGQGRVLYNLGIAEYHLRNYQSAVGYYRDAVTAYEDARDRLGAATALCSLAGAEIKLGSLDQAADHLELALQVFRDQKDLHHEAEALTGIAELSHQRGQLSQAITLFEQALAIYRDIDQPVGVASTLANLGEVSLRRCDYLQASSYLRQALTLYRQVGYQHGEIFVLRVLAETLHKTGQPAAARAELMTALTLAADTGNTYQQASSYRDLAESYHRDGQDRQARHHLQQALTLFAELSAPEAAHVRSRLSDLNRSPA